MAQALVLEGAPASARALVKVPPPGWRSLARGGATRCTSRGSATAAATPSAIERLLTLLRRLAVRTALRLCAGRLRRSAEAESGLHVEAAVAGGQVGVPVA